jgi:hypothetical protein
MALPSTLLSSERANWLRQSWPPIAPLCFSSHEEKSAIHFDVDGDLTTEITRGNPAGLTEMDNDQ